MLDDEWIACRPLPCDLSERIERLRITGVAECNGEVSSQPFQTCPRCGCHVLMSNSTAPEIAALYEDNEDAVAAGLRCYRIPARRAINSNAKRRGVVNEYLITNVRQGRSGGDGIQK